MFSKSWLLILFSIVNRSLCFSSPFYGLAFLDIITLCLCRYFVSGCGSHFGKFKTLCCGGLLMFIKILNQIKGKKHKRQLKASPHPYLGNRKVLYDKNQIRSLQWLICSISSESLPKSPFTNILNKMCTWWCLTSNLWSRWKLTFCFYSLSSVP